MSSHEDTFFYLSPLKPQTIVSTPSHSFSLLHSFTPTKDKQAIVSTPSLLFTPSLLDLRLFSDISENAAVNIEDMPVHSIRGV